MEELANFCLLSLRSSYSTKSGLEVGTTEALDSRGFSYFLNSALGCYLGLLPLPALYLLARLSTPVLCISIYRSIYHKTAWQQSKLRAAVEARPNRNPVTAVLRAQPSEFHLR